ncbi:hypothetical protein BU23DRAFT_568063 [Bimuria novae-zelandiae CBS 107.79]|uniref:Uncharacterized protein n=1 Tax=Bimuria novae-zelandiae CBS 107.79 TaxID=1447943 RepID=A0A6A5VCE4_9PLEO|nr:hypothetical protein BU23DRAFT_568063 [Bimuria novae-zelandiae CBS 107.79]
MAFELDNNMTHLQCLKDVHDRILDDIEPDDLPTNTRMGELSLSTRKHPLAYVQIDFKNAFCPIGCCHPTWLYPLDWLFDLPPVSVEFMGTTSEQEDNDILTATQRVKELQQSFMMNHEEGYDTDLLDNIDYEFTDVVCSPRFSRYKYSTPQRGLNNASAVSLLESKSDFLSPLIVVDILEFYGIGTVGTEANRGLGLWLSLSEAAERDYTTPSVRHTLATSIFRCILGAISASGSGLKSLSGHISTRASINSITHKKYDTKENNKRAKVGKRQVPLNIWLTMRASRKILKTGVDALFRFLDLAPELRNIIYEELVVIGKIFLKTLSMDPNVASDSRTRTTTESPSLLFFASPSKFTRSPRRSPYDNGKFLFSERGLKLVRNISIALGLTTAHDAMLDDLLRWDVCAVEASLLKLHRPEDERKYSLNYLEVDYRVVVGTWWGTGWLGSRQKHDPK